MASTVPVDLFAVLSDEQLSFIKSKCAGATDETVFGFCHQKEAEADHQSQTIKGNVTFLVTELKPLADAGVFATEIQRRSMRAASATSTIECLFVADNMHQASALVKEYRLAFMLQEAAKAREEAKTLVSAA